MLLVVGLGNPTSRYEGTRHNIGFRVIDELRARDPQVSFQDRFRGQFAMVNIGPSRVLLLKPQTYMNRSGFSVREAAAFYKIAPDQILVAHDEIDLPFGRLRLKVGGGEAGHNGLRSVSQQLGTKDYMRLRLGVGRPPPNFRGDAADYVLQAFPPGEAAQVDELVRVGAQAVELVLAEGVQKAMNQVNQKTN